VFSPRFKNKRKAKTKKGVLTLRGAWCKPRAGGDAFVRIDRLNPPLDSTCLKTFFGRINV
jgi:hypothetical protein